MHTARGARIPRGWSTLGDIGYVDEDGYLYLTNRQADTIVSGSVNVHPRESEEILQSHPSVADVAVIGVPDAEFGEAVRAIVQLEPGIEPTAGLAAELVQYCRNRLSPLK